MRTILSIILKRLLVGCMTLFVVTIIIFGAIEMLPGDIATEVLGQAATEESLNAFREKYDLNRSLPARYLSLLGGAITGDFGISLANQRPISELIGQRAATLAAIKSGDEAGLRMAIRFHIIDSMELTGRAVLEQNRRQGADGALAAAAV